MRKWTVAFLSLLLLASPVLVSAQETSNRTVKVGYVNLDRVLESYEPYQQAVDQLDQYRSDLQEEIANNREEIQGLREELEQGAQYLSEEARKKKQQELMQRMQMFQQSRQQSQQMMNQKEQEVLMPVREQVQGAVQAVAEAEGYDVIHRFGGQQPSTVLWVSPEVDLSTKVINHLDQQMSDTSQE